MLCVSLTLENPISLGMLKHFPSFGRKGRQGDLYEKFKKVQLSVRHWMWSWAEKDCESEEEYVLSKALFLSYVASTYVGNTLGAAGVEDLQVFFRAHVEPHEDFFAFHRRQLLLHFDTNSNSAHEGTNNGMKTHAAPVLPQHTLAKATQVISFQSRLKAAQIHMQITHKENSRKLWSNLPTANYLCDMGEALVGEEWKLRRLYDSVGPFQDGWEDYWLVMLADEDEVARAETEVLCPGEGIVPRFRRVRRVTRCRQLGTVSCSCGLFQRVGIPCRHVMHVCSQVLGVSYEGITHHDVLVIWHKSYYYYGAGTSCKMRSFVMDLRANDTNGPVLKEDPPTIPLDLNHKIVQLSGLDAVARCTNYHEEHCREALLRYGASNAAPANLTQEMYMNSNDDDNLRESQDFSFPSPMRAQEPDHFNLFAELIPYFKEYISVLDLNCTQKKLHDIKQHFSGLIAQEKKELAPAAAPQGRVVSSAAPTNKRRKTHGTAKYKTKKH